MLTFIVLALLLTVTPVTVMLGILKLPVPLNAWGVLVSNVKVPVPPLKVPLLVIPFLILTAEALPVKVPPELIVRLLVNVVTPERVVFEPLLIVKL